MVLIGLDLAWSEANPSGGVAIRWQGDRGKPFLWTAELGALEEIVGFVEEAAGLGPALVAVDAPLLVPNETGTRPCDRELSAFYRKAQAQAYPANRRRLGPRVRGEALVAALKARGFTFQSRVEKRKLVRQVVEVFPHPAMIELFGLPRILRYKARPNRSLSFRLAELRRYWELLGGLSEAEPALDTAPILSQTEISGLKGRELKAAEDLLDALYCAYIALHLWYWGEEGYRVFGDEGTGFILVPIRPKGRDHA
ncbi:DUF429 domain-containing protein [Candidatus Bipolaricaulota bacterium]|nr:DUF429 domain-containing protein [Candidatus Bipolaricaulota bacterium]